MKNSQLSPTISFLLNRDTARIAHRAFNVHLQKVTTMNRTLLGIAALAVTISLSQANVTQAQGRFAVVHIKNSTKSSMSVYRTWVWNYGKSTAKTQISWRVNKIQPGRTITLRYTYQSAAAKSPDLIVVFDSDRNKGSHWQKVKLTKAQSRDYKDSRQGFRYELTYDSARREYGSLRPRNGGKVTVLDRKMPRPPRVK